MPLRRVYLVAAPGWIHDEVTLYLEAAKHTVVHRDSPGEPPLSGLDEALEKRADAAVVFMRREEVSVDGRSGADVVRELDTRAPVVTILSFSKEEGSLVPGIDIHRRRTGERESYMGLGTDMTMAFRRNRYL